MTGRSAWTPGNGNGGAGLTFANLFNSSDLASLGVGSSVLSTVSIANQNFLDQFMSISVELLIASSAVGAGAVLSLWLAALQEDGSTYGDGIFAPGVAQAITPGWNPIGAIPLLQSTTARTSLIGSVDGIIIPPRQFSYILQNNSGFALTSGAQAARFITYNQNLNN